VRPSVFLLLLIVLVIAGAAGCGTDSAGRSDRIDRTPENIEGVPSQEFEDADIDRAESAPADVQAYCSGAVSEAQRVGCLSHVDSGDIP
jgi:hypothetical protein